MIYLALTITQGSYRNSFIVIEARIDVRLSKLQARVFCRASMFELRASIQASSPSDNVLTALSIYLAHFPCGHTAPS
jgi:hypothetical protein